MRKFLCSQTQSFPSHSHTTFDQYLYSRIIRLFPSFPLVINILCLLVLNIVYLLAVILTGFFFQLLFRPNFFHKLFLIQRRLFRFVDLRAPYYLVGMSHYTQVIFFSCLVLCPPHSVSMANCEFYTGVFYYAGSWRPNCKIFKKNKRASVG